MYLESLYYNKVKAKMLTDNNSYLHTKGDAKPNCPHEFFEPFCTEVKKLEAEGLEHNGKHYNVVVEPYIMDTPAKCFSTGCKGHGGN